MLLLSSVRLEQLAHNQLAAGSNPAGATKGVGLATLPTKGPMDIMGNMVSSNGLNHRTTTALLKVLGGLGTGELNLDSSGFSFSHFCQIDANHPVELGRTVGLYGDD